MATAAPAHTQPVPALPSATQRSLVGATLVISTLDVIDTKGVNAGREFRGRLEQPVQSGGTVVAPQGAEVALKVQNQGSGGSRNFAHLYLTVQSITVDGQPLVLESSGVSKTIDTSPQPLAVGPVTLGPRGLQIRRAPRPMPNAIGHNIPDHTRLVFRVVRAGNLR